MNLRSKRFVVERRIGATGGGARTQANRENGTDRAQDYRRCVAQQQYGLHELGHAFTPAPYSRHHGSLPVVE